MSAAVPHVKMVEIVLMALTAIVVSVVEDLKDPYVK